MMFSIFALGVVYHRLLTADPGFLDPFGFLGNARGTKAVNAAFRARFAATGSTASTRDVEAGHSMPRIATVLVQETEHITNPEMRNSAVCFSCELVKVGGCSLCPCLFCQAPLLPCRRRWVTTVWAGAGAPLEALPVLRSLL